MDTPVMDENQKTVVGVRSMNRPPAAAQPEAAGSRRIAILHAGERLAAESLRDAVTVAMPGWRVRAAAVPPPEPGADCPTPRPGGGGEGGPFRDSPAGSTVVLWKPQAALIEAVTARPFRYRVAVVCPSPIPASWAEAAVACGPVAAVTDGEGLETLIAAVQSAAAGRPFLSPAAESGFRLEGRSLAAAPPESGRLLTSRQVEVLRMLALGYSIRETATALSLTERTVESHRYRVCKRLGVHDRSELVRIAIREGLVAA